VLPLRVDDDTEIFPFKTDDVKYVSVEALPVAHNWTCVQGLRRKPKWPDSSAVTEKTRRETTLASGFPVFAGDRAAHFANGVWK